MILATLFIFQSHVVAETATFWLDNRNSSTGSPQITRKPTKSVIPSTFPFRRGANPTSGIEKKALVRERVCQVINKNLDTRGKNFVTHVNRMIETTQKIFERVKNFYQNKVVANGGSVANYDTLVGAVEAKKSAVQTALTQFQTDMSAVVCDPTTPPGTVMSGLKTKMKTVMTAIQEYKKALRELIIQVHKGKNQLGPTGATGEEPQATDEPTITVPTVTPTVVPL